MLAYLQLMEMDRLEAAATADADCGRAKQMAAAFHEPDRIWKQHDEVRAEILRGPEARPQRPAPTFDDVLRIHRMMQGAGLIPPTSEAN